MSGGDLLVLFCLAQVCVDKCLKAISTIIPISIKKTFSAGPQSDLRVYTFGFLGKPKAFAKE